MDEEDRGSSINKWKGNKNGNRLTWSRVKDVRGFFRFGGVLCWYGCPIRRASGKPAQSTSRLVSASSTARLNYIYLHLSSEYNQTAECQALIGGGDPQPDKIENIRNIIAIESDIWGAGRAASAQFRMLFFPISKHGAIHFSGGCPIAVGLSLFTAPPQSSQPLPRDPAPARISDPFHFPPSIPPRPRIHLVQATTRSVHFIRFQVDIFGFRPALYSHPQLKLQTIDGATFLDECLIGFLQPCFQSNDFVDWDVGPIYDDSFGINYYATIIYNDHQLMKWETWSNLLQVDPWRRWPRGGRRKRWEFRNWFRRQLPCAAACWPVIEIPVRMPGIPIASEPWARGSRPPSTK